MNASPGTNPKPPQKSQHLDEFPDEVDHIAWERAILERARLAGVFSAGPLNPKEDLFWQKLRAYEAREISKRRQRYKPSRLERFDELAESRVERGIRHGLVDDAAMKCETKMQRRAERFGIKTESSVDGVLAGGVLDWMTDEQRLKMRRARFAKEPRDDAFYRKEWVSESVGDDGIMDEQRMAQRKKRFSAEAGSQKGFNMKEDKMNTEMDGKPGKESNDVQDIQNKDRFKHNENDVEAMEATAMESDGQLLQEWERTCQSWGTQDRPGNHEIRNTREKDPFAQSENRAITREAMEMESDGNVLQEWERRCESWTAPGDGVDRGNAPDAVRVNDVTRVTGGQQMMELTKENLLSMVASDEGDGKVLQSWEAGGEEW